MHHTKRWNIATPSQAAGELADSLKTSPLIAQMLLNRGIGGPTECQAFLSPSLRQLYEPDLIPNLRRSAERIAGAIRDGQKIVIYGDYDVDGITATAILWHAIRLLGGVVDYYIPHRLEEGYGLNAEALAQICEQGAKLIVSVDCGITAVQEVTVACERGVELIVTDHHEWREGPAAGDAQDNRKDAGDRITDEEAASAHPSSFGPHDYPILPECYAVVHPRLPDNQGRVAYPNPHLCGAGVAFKLAWGIGQAVSGGAKVGEEFKRFLVEATGLAGLGTIADVVPLVGENRTLAYFGLGGLKQSKLIGIKALIESAGLTGQKLESYHAGFLLAPRLNACGRMGHAALAVELLTNADEARAEEIAGYLEKQNRTRQEIERKIFGEAVEQVERLGLDGAGSRAIVLGAEGWHPGVIGIVASRLVNRFNRPAIMVAMTNGHGQGSGRSIPGFHLARALGACREHLEACGGHEMAAGLRIETDRFEAFRAAFCEHAYNTLSAEMLVPELRLDCQAELREVTLALAGTLDRLGPFGMGNPKPRLFFKAVEIVGQPRRVGVSGNHLQIMARQGPARVKCIAFNHGEWFDSLHPGVKVDLAAEVCINEFHEQRTAELEIKDVRLA